MMKYENCTCAELEDGSTLIENVQTPYGIADSIYLGIGGIYIILAQDAQAAPLYAYFRELLGAARVKLYVSGRGEYDPATDSIAAAFDREALLDSIYEYLHKPPQQYTAAALERMQAAVCAEDARQRGFYCEQDGTVYLLKHGAYRRASELDPEKIFRLCLYGGFFGIHRFAVGKWFTGLLYLFTCGFFLIGWLTDLLQLFCGILKDRHKNLLLPLPARRQKLRLLPLSFLIGACALVFYLQMFSAASGLTGSVLFSQAPAAGNGIQNLFEILSPLAPR